MCDRDTIKFVMFTVWVFTFVGAYRTDIFAIAQLSCNFLALKLPAPFSFIMVYSW